MTTHQWSALEERGTGRGDGLDRYVREVWTGFEVERRECLGVRGDGLDRYVQCTRAQGNW